MTLTTPILPIFIVRTFTFSMFCHTVPIEMSLGSTEEIFHLYFTGFTANYKLEDNKLI